MKNIVKSRFIVKLRLIYKANGNLVTPRYIVKLRFIVKARIVKSRSDCILMHYAKGSIKLFIYTKSPFRQWMKLLLNFIWFWMWAFNYR